MSYGPWRKAIFGVLGVVSVVADWYSVSTAPGFGEYGFELSNFLSYFTILMNVFLAAWFLSAAVWGKDPSWFGYKPTIRGSLLAYALVTVAVYWTLLAPTHHPNGIVGKVANVGLHLVMPFFMLLEMALHRPVVRASWTFAFWMIVSPLVYAAYTLIRGPFVDWYPYFFIDPRVVGSYATLAWIVAAFVAFFVVVGFAIRLLWNAFATTSAKNPEA